ncbi:VOC family protein [Poseidonocella sp. HB161398]|uniref:VOC family protein n=1 Tax=Poseidonocella sp. HB161398 TaxID=2320855 RepID=UPI001108D2BF|nr:VOC family protein [Poseidonocella sp. HB161398]
MSASADHFIVLVRDIDQAVADYRTLGFTVQSRADSECHGALYRFVVLADGSYILLTQFTSDEVIARHRLGPDLAEGEGFADWSFTVADVASVTEAVAAAGGDTRGPVTVSNVLADGSKWGLKLLMTGKGTRGTRGDDTLPFVVEDTHGREFRIPAYAPHPNGIERVAAIRATSPRPADSARSLAVALGTETDGTTVPVAQGIVSFVDAAAASPAGRIRGGLYELDLAGSGASAAEMLDLGLTHGARLNVVAAGA